jgi:hypothetical protein
VNSEYYKSVRTPTKRRATKTAGKAEEWIVLHHDNAPCHTSLIICQFLADKKITVCPHPSNSPDLAPCDFWLFPKIKLTIKGNHFDTIPEIEATTKERLRALTKDDF